jgi:hypothetical protein
MIQFSEKIKAVVYEWLQEGTQSPNFERSELKAILKEELGKLGHWKNLPRGKPHNFKE